VTALQMTAISWPNPNAKTYALETVEMSDFPMTVMFDPPFKAFAPGWNQVGVVGRRLLHPIFEEQRARLRIIFLNPAHLLLVKQGPAGWEEIDSSVVEAAVKTFHRKVELVEAV